ncbi:MAG: B12-binding domain-containing radical SAM protein, partial [Planctomycetes bacterium]|nr:B12-binding domain-containing radical SAM protein [Planctomycetota bacterium]
APMVGLERLREIRGIILDKARCRSVRYKFNDPKGSLLEAALARGDRRVGRVIRRAREAGAQFDAWREHFSFERWEEAFRLEGMSLESYATRERAEDEALPWEHIDFGLTRAFLLRERKRAARGELTPDCRVAGCDHCGACTLIPPDS